VGFHSAQSQTPVEPRQLVFNKTDRTVTALTTQKKNPNRVSVFLDGKFAFGLSRITAAWLQVGQSLTDEKIARLLEQDAAEVAYQRALEMLNYRSRSEKEVRQRLTEKGFRSEVIEAVLERLVKAGLVSDEGFARAWVENRLTFRPRSRRMVRAELLQKGVEQETIEQALNDLPAEEEMAYQTASKYMRRLEDLDLETFRRKLSGYLGRKGFGYETVAEVVRRIWQEMNDGPAESE
jgi:regulatory protein